MFGDMAEVKRWAFKVSSQHPLLKILHTSQVSMNHGIFIALFSRLARFLFALILPGSECLSRCHE